MIYPIDRSTQPWILATSKSSTVPSPLVPAGKCREVADTRKHRVGPDTSRMDTFKLQKARHKAQKGRGGSNQPLLTSQSSRRAGDTYRLMLIEAISSPANRFAEGDSACASRTAVALRILRRPRVTFKRPRPLTMHRTISNACYSCILLLSRMSLPSETRRE